MTEFWAHSAPKESVGPAHALRDHLQDVADGSRRHAEGLNCPPWAYLAGLWHDLGKYRPGFQRYIRQVGDAHIEGKLPANSDKSHSAAGALHAMRIMERQFGPSGATLARALAYVIAGHHAGLADWTASLDQRLLGAAPNSSQREHDEAIATCQAHHPDLLAWPVDFSLQQMLATIPGARSDNPLALSLWIRLLFSALVDADFLDTEAFMDRERPTQRAGFQPILDYLHQLDAFLDDKAAQVAKLGRADDPVMRARADVLQQCRTKAAFAPGVYTLTVPTGGGKTLSSLAFALRHAVAHGQRRVIYAIPYTSIIEQTADVFAGIFGADQLVEHHSQADPPKDSGETARSRLASENWDAPLIVTTNVQLFESLFAARTSRCRKLHRIAGSVIVLDEAQLLPPEFLQPILDALNVLVTHYGVTLLLCTATQPALTDTQRFDPRKNLRGLPAPTPLIDDEASLYAALRRVDIEWPADLQTPLPTSELVEQLAEQDCVLTIVNTRKDAAEIVAALDSATAAPTLHLSAAMCGQHRADVIRDIRNRLAARRDGGDSRPLRVVSTQLVEAGVDIDFPVVFRALAGLDSVAQAAGRCNREGRLADGELGRVVVFVREIPKSLSQLRYGAQATRSTLLAGLDDALTPTAFTSYFPQYYAQFDSRDRHGIVQDLATSFSDKLAINFRTAADKFKLVDDADQTTVIVPYLSTDATAIAVTPLIGKLKQGATDRWILRQLQRYTVTVRRKQVEIWQQRGDVQEIQPGLYLLIDVLRYDNRYGLLPEGEALAASSLVQ